MARKGRESGFFRRQTFPLRYHLHQENLLKEQEIVVVVIAVGIRRDNARDDIYALAKKLFRLGLVGG